MTDMISFVPTAAASASSTNAATDLAGNFNTFLTILTAQIQNQDPLQPMDSTQFTQQLVQFSGVEQQIKTNTDLDSMIKNSQGATGAALAGYLGQNVEINQAGAEFTGSPIDWKYNLPSDAASTTVTVTDKNGNVIYSQPGDTAAGDHDFTWSGQLFNGSTASSGSAYAIKVVATDANNKAITPTQSVVSTVTGVDMSYGDPALTTTNGVYAYSDVIRLSQH